MTETEKDACDASNEPRPVASFLADEPPPAPPTLRSMLVKYGWRTGIAGMLVTVLGSWQLSLDSAKHSILPQLIHSVGLIIMLGGCGVALVGYRLPWLIRIGNAMKELSQSDRQRIAGSGGTSAAPALVWSAGLVAICAGLPLFALFLLVMWALPAWLAGLIIYVANLLLTVTAVVTVASGSRLQRAFALGAMVPLLCLIVESWFISPSAAARFGGSGQSFGEPSFFMEMRKVGVVLSYVGEGRLGTMIVWLAAACAGMVAVAVRSLLYRFNRF